MTTALTLLTDAMVEIGAIGLGEAPPAEDAAHALRVLNRMIDSWALERFYAYHVAWQTFALGGNMTRTIGAGGQINVARPVRIEMGAYTTDDGIDEPLEQINQQQWAAIDIKALGGTRPRVFYYDAASPLGVLYFYPQDTCSVSLPVQTALSQFAALSTDYTLPPGYESAILYSLAQRLCAPFNRPVPASLANTAMLARKAVKRENFTVPQLDLGLPSSSPEARFFAGE